jgi:hypothetical protein
MIALIYTQEPSGSEDGRHARQPSGSCTAPAEVLGNYGVSKFFSTFVSTPTGNKNVNRI